MTVMNGDDPALPEPQAEAEIAELEARITAIVEERGNLLALKYTCSLTEDEAERLEFLTAEARRLIPAITPEMWEIVDNVIKAMNAPNVEVRGAALAASQRSEAERS